MASLSCGTHGGKRENSRRKKMFESKDWLEGHKRIYLKKNICDSCTQA